MATHNTEYSKEMARHLRKSLKHTNNELGYLLVYGLEAFIKKYPQYSKDRGKLVK